MSTRREPDRVRVHIERLVLDGVDGYDHPADRRRLDAALTAALVAQLREHPIGVPTWSHRHREGGGSVNAGAGVTPEQLGRQVAGAVHRGLAR